MDKILIINNDTSKNQCRYYTANLLNTTTGSEVIFKCGTRCYTTGKVVALRGNIALVDTRKGNYRIPLKKLFTKM